MARSGKSRTRSTRKAVTIDLEPNAVTEDMHSEDLHSEDLPSKDLQTQDRVTEAEDSEVVAATADDGLTGDGDTAAQEAHSPDEPAQVDDAVHERDDEPVTAPTPSRSGSSLGLVGSGLVGGVLALLGGAGLQWAGVLPSASNAPQQIVDIAPLQSEIATLRQQVEGQTGAGGADPQLVARLDAAETRVNEADSALSALRETVSGLESELASANAALASGVGGEAAAVASLSTRLDAIDRSIETLTATTGDATALEGITGQISDIETALRGEISAVRETLAALETRVSEAESTLAEGGGRDVARAIAAAGLKSAIDRGGAFMTELEAYASVAGDTETVTALRDHAASGVATLAQLLDAFPATANAIIATGQGVAQDAGMIDRLMASARGLVQVRPVGEVEGDSPGAIAARMETRLKDGNIAGMISEWETLPDAAKAVSSEFIERARARVTVDGLVARSLTGAMAATSDNN